MLLAAGAGAGAARVPRGAWGVDLGHGPGRGWRMGIAQYQGHAEVVHLLLDHVVEVLALLDDGTGIGARCAARRGPCPWQQWGGSGSDGASAGRGDRGECRWRRRQQQR
jgi:hypothetical protein